MNELMLPGDTFDIDLNAKALTMPTVGPLMGSFKLQLDVFLCPFRLYQAQLHNNKLGVGLDMSKIKLPQFEGEANMINFSFGESPDTQQVNPSSLIAYQGTRGFGCAENEEDGHVTYRRNALKLLSYYDIYKNYYANKQEGKGAIISNSDESIEISSVASTRVSVNRNMTPSSVIPTRINDSNYIEIVGENLLLSNLRGFYVDDTQQQNLS